MNKYLIDVAAYRFFDGKRILEKIRQDINVNAKSKGEAFGKALELFYVMMGNPNLDCSEIELRCVRVGDALR